MSLLKLMGSTEKSNNLLDGLVSVIKPEDLANYEEDHAEEHLGSDTPPLDMENFDGYEVVQTVVATKEELSLIHI